jgi:uncharacterized repeat protein (TIGR03803 family)
MSKLGCWRTICVVCIFCAAEAIGSPATITYRILVSFDGTNGAYPEYMSLVQGLNGSLYGTTAGGGVNNYGTVFKITPSGTLTTIYNFCSQTNCTDGSVPYPGLLLATNGTLYGITTAGGTNSSACYGSGCGTVFKITPSGTLTTIYNFCSQTNCTDGNAPVAGLVQGTDGSFYGTTTGGGSAHCPDGCGTVFKITPTGALTTLHSFDVSDGDNPWAGLVQAIDGNFYGTTVNGGANSSACYGSGCGTVFKITPSGNLTTIYNFCPQTNCPDGRSPITPFAGLVQGADGKLYGTTQQGGNGSGCGNGCGTVFKITPSGTLTTLHNFDKPGGYPYAGLVQATDGDFYGTTFLYRGTVFKITPSGTLTTLHNFLGGGGGEYPQGGLVQATNGKFYGATSRGGVDHYGTVFSLSVGLGPFVKTLPTSGKVGAHVIILGNNLKGTTSVAFNDTAASFTVVSNTEIKTTVPISATTGFVTVTTPKETLKSNLVFRVTK